MKILNFVTLMSIGSMEQLLSGVLSVQFKRLGHWFGGEGTHIITMICNVHILYYLFKYYSNK